MERDEEIIKASTTTFKENGDEFSKVVQLFWMSAFLSGAHWADKHPANVWHDASEEPRHNELMLGIDSDGVSLYKWCEQEDSWDSFVTITELSRWAYISDLLP